MSCEVAWANVVDRTMIMWLGREVSYPLDAAGEGRMDECVMGRGRGFKAAGERVA